MPPTARPDFVSRLLAVLSAPAVNVSVGILGPAAPIVAWSASKVNVKNGLPAVETALLLLVVANHLILRRMFVQLRRANNKEMSDPAYFDAVRTHLEEELIVGFDKLPLVPGVTGEGAFVAL